METIEIGSKKEVVLTKEQEEMYQKAHSINPELTRDAWQKKREEIMEAKKNTDHTFVKVGGVITEVEGSNLDKDIKKEWFGRN